MQQTIEGKSVYVVDLKEAPELPITGLTEDETEEDESTYAQILTHAIISGIITGPGKYGLYKVPDTKDYEIFSITE